MKNNQPAMKNKLSKLLNKKVFFVVCILFLTTFFLLNSFKDIDIDKLKGTFSHTKYSYLLAWIGMFLITTLLRAYRWKFLIPAKNLKFPDLFHSLNIGNLASMILPFRAGEFIRPFYLNEWAKIGFPKAMTSVVIERVFDVLGMFSIYFIFVKDLEGLPDYIKLSSRGLGLIAFILLSGMLVSRFFPNQVRRVANFCLRFLPPNISEKFFRLFEEVLEGLGAIKTVSQLLIILVLTLLTWTIYVSGFTILLPAFSQEPNFTVGAVTCVFVGLAIAAPNAPGFILTFELGCTLALGVFAYSKEFSLAYALVAHALQFFSAVFVGLFSLIKKGLSYNSLKINS